MNFFSTTGFIIIIILTIVNWGIYGLFVRRLYFSREAIWRDIIVCFFVAFIEWAIIVWLLAKILIGFLSVLRVIAWIGLIGFSVLIIYVVICIIKKKTGVYASTQMVERCSRCGEICSGGKFCVKCGSPVIVQYYSADDDDDEDKSKIELFGSTVEPFPAIGISALLIVVSIVLITCIPKWQDSIREKIGEKKEVIIENQQSEEVSLAKQEAIDIYPLRHCPEGNVDEAFGHPIKTETGRYKSEGMTAVCMGGEVVLIAIESTTKYCFLGVSCEQNIEEAQYIISDKYPYLYDEDLGEGFKEKAFGDISKEVVEVVYEESTGKVVGVDWADMSAIAYAYENEDNASTNENYSDSAEYAFDADSNYYTGDNTQNIRLEDLVGTYRSDDGKYTASISDDYYMEIYQDVIPLSEQITWKMSLCNTEGGINYTDGTRVCLRVKNDGSIENDISYTGGKGSIIEDVDRLIWNNETENLRVLFVKADTNDIGGFEGNNENDYLIPDSDYRRITDEDLNTFSAHECMLARNEIYARRGRKFQNEEIQEYFNGKSWYVPIYEPEEFNESLLNAYENYNKDYIVEYEKRMGYK